METTLWCVIYLASVTSISYYHFRGDGDTEEMLNDPIIKEAMLASAEAEEWSADATTKNLASQTPLRGSNRGPQPKNILRPISATNNKSSNKVRTLYCGYRSITIIYTLYYV